MKEEENILLQELIQAGASPEEAKQLASLGKSLSKSIKLERPLSVKRTFLNQYKGKRKLQKLQEYQKYKNRFLFAIPVLIILLIVLSTSAVMAQGSKPGDFLYPLKVLAQKIYSGPYNKQNLQQSLAKDNKPKISSPSASKTQNPTSDSSEQVTPKATSGETGELNKEAGSLKENAENIMPSPVEEKASQAESKVDSAVNKTEDTVNNVIDQVRKTLPSL